MVFQLRKMKIPENELLCFFAEWNHKSHVKEKKNKKIFDKDCWNLISSVNVQLAT